jgi:MoaD family protein
VLKLIVKVLFFTSLREITGKKEESLDFAVKDKVTINKILRVLNERYGTPFEEYVYDPKTHNVRGFLQFLINGKSVSSINVIETKLNEGDVLAILPPVGGG